ncbi:MAG: hypothetical protein H0T76_28290 [Nannocystis sp.]|nr:hypothetical protein [Nannocystis sp.]MBA3550393.1 hypothetical protein [Nannocystis sp.]
MVGTPQFPYEPAGMVRWYSPLQLIQTARQVATSTFLGADFDRRQIDPRTSETYALFDFTTRTRADGTSEPREEIVLDYIADTGDGWDPTYAIAYTATRPQLELEAPDGQRHSTRRGEVLVFGGDQVYPTPSRAAYEQRLVMPFHAAMGWTEGDHPHLFAIPGNHDWYDNLASFVRLFTEKEWFCGWKLGQRRSYFALRLPHDWWVIGVDTQLGADIDATQVAYFKSIAAQMGPTARVILCTAEPHWVFEHEVEADERARMRRDSNLVFLEETIFQGRVRVNLSGDFHHYRRHASLDDRSQKITSGSGGAFLHPTHTFKQTPLPDGKTLRASYPDIATSRRLAWRNLFFIRHSPTFGAMTGLLYLLVGWNLLGGLQGYLHADLLPALTETCTATLRSPASFTTIVLALLGFVVFTDTHKTWYRYFGGLSHGLAHIGAALTIGWSIGLVAQAAGWSFGGLAHVGLTLVALFFGGWLIGSLVMGLYLLISINLYGRHSNEAFSGLGIPDYKQFLRLVVGRDGALTIYPIAIDRVPRRWKPTTLSQHGAAPGAPREQPRFIPDDDDPRGRPRLIEAPIVVPP